MSKSKILFDPSEPHPNTTGFGFYAHTFSYFKNDIIEVGSTTDFCCFSLILDTPDTPGTPGTPGNPGTSGTPGTPGTSKGLNLFWNLVYCSLLLLSVSVESSPEKIKELTIL